MKAKEKLLSMAHEKELESYCVEIPAKADYHRFLIGKKGANVQKVITRLRLGVDQKTGVMIHNVCSLGLVFFTKRC